MKMRHLQLWVKKKRWQQAKKLKDQIYNEAYTSMLIRAQETLRIMLEAIQQTNLPVIKNAALDERMYGNLQGLNKADTIAKYGEDQVQIWRRSYNVRPPGGESLKDTFNRAVPYYKSAIEPKLKSGENILVVAHGNSLRALLLVLYYFKKIPKEKFMLYLPKPYCVSLKTL